MIIKINYNSETGKGAFLEFTKGNSAAPYRVKSYNLKIDQRFNDYNNALQYLDSINP